MDDIYAAYGLNHVSGEHPVRTSTDSVDGASLVNENASNRFGTTETKEARDC